MNKICNVCKTEKPIDDFYFRKDRNEYANKCKRCQIDKKVIEKSPTHKKCKHCGIEKPFAEFNAAGGGKWLQPYCKPCDSIRKKKYNEANADKVKERAQRYFQKNQAAIKQRAKDRWENNKDELKAYSKQYRDNNKEVKRQKDKDYGIKNRKKITAQFRQKREANPDLYREKGKLIRANKTKEQRDRQSELAKMWRMSNTEKLKQYRIENIEAIRENRRISLRRKANDIQFRILKRLRGRVYSALRGVKKSDTTVNLLGCSIGQFKEYFAATFTEGMTWEAYKQGEIHIDHKRPCSLFDLTKEEEQRKCFHYSNLQALWGIDNLKKGTYYNEQ